jgi:glycyl-tRNA synthetase beta chain
MTTMRHHQKYLTIDAPGGRLMNAFVAVLTTDPDREGTIRRGNEWVLKARLADAKFFFEEDQKRPLRERTADLAKVTFHARLGTYREKVDRMRRLVESAGASLRHAPAMTQDDQRDLIEALDLCKTDLTTGMVGEFPELQGVVGGIYLRMQGHSEGCARAAEEHYRPLSATSALPSRGPASVIAIADKLDTLAVCFAAGLVPKGSADPYGLRRAATGVLRILAENEIAADLDRLVDAALAAAPAAAASGAEKRPSREKAGGAAATPGASLRDFLRQRLQFLMEESGIRFDAARAVLAAGWSNPLDAWRRARALNALRGQDDFLAVAAAAKRVRNILSQARERGAAVDAPPCDEKLIAAGAESSLRAAMESASARVSEAAARADHERALSAIASLRPAVDRFFEEVLVMDPDEKIRANRLALLADLARLLSREADFAEIVVEGETPGRRGSEVITGGTT